MHSIIIIDENPDIRHVLRLLLRRAGYQASAAADLHQAVAIAQLTAPQLLLIDISQLHTSIRAPAEYVRMQGMLRPAALIAMSSMHVFRRREIQALGYTDFIAKPFELRELIGRIERALGQAARLRLVV